MAEKKKNLSEHDANRIPNAKGMRFGILVSEWNPQVTESLLEAAVKTLLDNGAQQQDIRVEYVPGSFELPGAAKIMIDTINPGAVICIGCVIQGETRHFEFICNAVANSIANLNTTTGIPVIFGVLTTDNFQQALDRAGGKHGNKGDEAAVAAIKMAALKKSLQ